MAPPVQYLTMAVLIMAALGVFNTAVATTPEPRLPRCPPGTYLATSPEGRDECPPCPEGFYMDKDDRKRSCIRHRVCKKSEELLFPGTATTDSVCTCKEGERRIYNVDESYGYSCYPCKEGLFRQNVTGPFDKGDTGCCPSDTVATRDKLGKLWCSPVTRMTSLVPSSPTVTTPGSKVSNAEEMSPPWWIYCIIAAVLLLIIIAITIAYFVLRKQKQQRLKMKITDEIEPLSSQKLPRR